MLRYYYGLLLILYSFTTNGQAVSASYGDGCRLNFFNANGFRIFSLRGDELRYWYNSSGQVIVRDENTQITTSIAGIASLIDSIQDVCVKGACNSAPPTPTGIKYCGITVANRFNQNDTINNITPLFDNFYGISSFKIDGDTTRTLITFCSNEVSYPLGFNFNDYLFNNPPNAYCDPVNVIPNNLPDFSNCDSIVYYSYDWDSINYVAPFYYQEPYPPLPEVYDTVYIDYTIRDAKSVTVNIGSDTLITNDYLQYYLVPSNKNVRIKRVSGIAVKELVLDTLNSTISITAYPVKTYDKTYQTSSLKVYKIASANINSTEIIGETFDPNIGIVSKELPIALGKNTFKVSVETIGVGTSYLIFQITKNY